MHQDFTDHKFKCKCVSLPRATERLDIREKIGGKKVGLRKEEVKKVKRSKKRKTKGEAKRRRTIFTTTVQRM